MSILNKLTEGIVNRDLQQEGAALRSKWERTGLLEGLSDDRYVDTMAVLLENQAKELLREASSMAQGDVEGFAAVAFPIVRRVFGGLIANDLVSVQPMSLPSGLIFFLDFQHRNDRLGITQNDSVFGGARVGQEITGGVKLDGATSGIEHQELGFYNLSNGYTSPTASVELADGAHGIVTLTSGVFGKDDGGASGVNASSYKLDALCRFDPDLNSGSTKVVVGKIAVAGLTSSNGSKINMDNLIALTAGTFTGSVRQIRRLTRLSGTSRNHVLVFFAAEDGDGHSFGTLRHQLTGASNVKTYHMPIVDNFGGTPAAGADGARGAVVGTDDWGLENNPDIPEIDIKVDSVSVTAVTKKLKAKWTPELGQDLNAYHNLDAEVELTSILSEQIALEIDREILNDLVVGATAGRLYWSRLPGAFVDRETGKRLVDVSGAPEFTGTVSEWYETLIETINDVSARIHRKTLRGGANFLVVGPEVANLLEFTAGFRANVTHDDSKGTVGAVNVGSLSKKWDVWVDPYFPRNVCLVGRKGNSFLESGYVYAPYVPLQVTPTIFGPEDFVPRKGVMTRYAKKMVRPDMYGLVVVRDMIGATS